MNPTTITVYAIAWGGKFIGFGQSGVAKLTVTDPTGNIVAGVKDAPITQGTIPTGGDGSGNVDDIMQTATYWGTPVNKTAAYSYTFSFQPQAPVQLTFTVQVYHYGELKATASVQQVVWPGLTLAGDQALVVVVPGLLTHIVAHQTPLVGHCQQPLSFQANVYMMCGCMTNNNYWPSTNFNVQAVITDPNGQVVASVPMQGAQEMQGGKEVPVPATFSGTWTPLLPGDFTLQVFVVETINGNTAFSAVVGVEVFS